MRTPPKPCFAANVPMRSLAQLLQVVERFWNVSRHVHGATIESPRFNSISAFPVKPVLLALILPALPLLAADPVAASRTAGDYRVTITLADSETRGIASIIVQHGKDRYTLPPSLFDDIRAPHIGPDFKARDFRFETKSKMALIRIKASPGQHPDDHAWILSLPLNSARRITRSGDVTGYLDTRLSTPLSK